MAYCITGATGFVGGHLAARFLGTGRSVRALVRHSSVVPDGVEAIRGDLLERPSLDAFVNDGDTVIHLAYLRADRTTNLRATENLVAVCRERAARFIHVSTAAVYGRASDRVVTEETAPRPVGQYQTVKLEIEQILSSAFRDRVTLAIVQPTAVFGRGGQNLVKAARNLKNGPAVINYLRRSFYGRRRMNLVAIENVVTAIEHLISIPITGDPRFIVSDDDNLSNDYRSIAALICSELKCRTWNLPDVPGMSSLLPALLRARGAWPVDPQQVFSSEKLRATGYRPAVSFEGAVRNYAAWLAATNAL